MSTNDNITKEISTTDVNLTGEMDVQPNQASQTDEANTPVSVETTKTDTSISAMSDSKPDGTAAMIQLLLNKFDEKFDKFDIKFNEIKNEIKLGHNHLIKNVTSSSQN